MRLHSLLLLAACGLAACATAPPVEPRHDAVVKLDADAPATHVSAFSKSAMGSVPPGWTQMVIFKNKKRTDYQVVAEQQKTVLRAYAAGASSGLMQHVQIDPLGQPWISWQWKIGDLGEKLVDAQDLMEDAPARIILGFDGDKGELPFSEQILFETAKVITGHDFPYATLMYEWNNKTPAGSIMHSKRSSRIRTIVVESGKDHLGKWRGFSRNIVEDFEKAYGEKPGKLIGVGILTDSDFTGETIETWYGDIRLSQQKP